MLHIDEFERVLLTHPLVPAGPIPTARDAEGVYPYESFCETARRPVLKRYRFVAIENRHLRAIICPDLGGKVYSLTLKAGERECLFVPNIIRPIRILPRHAFIGGGIEVSFPVSHTPVLLESVCIRHSIKSERAYVWCGEREVRFGMHWTVEFSLGPEDRFLTQRRRFKNETAKPHPWMSWSNAGVPARPDTEFHYPGGPVLSHSQTVQTIDWHFQGPRRQADVKRMNGFFWKAPDAQAFGVFTPSRGCGLYHVADVRQVPGMKLWTDGCGVCEPWVTQMSLDRSQFVEMQSGPIIDQSLKHLLNPGEVRCHTEFWLPADVPCEVRSLEVPEVELVPPDDIPWFDWARPETVQPWLQVISAHKSRNPDSLPAPPDETSNNWAPSGLEELGIALRWAAKSANDRESRSRWLFQLGAWHTGCDEIDGALEALEASGDGRAHALAGRLYRRVRQDAHAAVTSFSRISNDALAHHPQIVFERDLALAALGPETLPERHRWLDATSGLADEWLIERRAALSADEGRWIEARNLLASTTFQLVHQRYARTRLWKRIQEALDCNDPIPLNWLGEDDLHEFGLHREYDEDAEAAPGNDWHKRSAH